MNDTTTTPFNLLGRGPLPHDEQMETAVLACVLLDPKGAMQEARRLTAKSFYKVAHQVIFQAMLDLNENNGGMVDEILLANSLQKSGNLENVGGRAYLTQLSCYQETAANIEKYVDVVHQLAVLRRLIDTAATITDRCYAADGDVMQLVDTIETEVMEISKDHSTNRTIGMNVLAGQAFDYLTKLVEKDLNTLGLQTGFVDMDKLITGLRPGEMIVLAARPSIGKTAFALNIAANIALNAANPASVGIFSLEMGSEMLALRLLCSEAEISLGDVRDNTLPKFKWQEIHEAVDRLKKAPIFIDDTPGLDILELRAKARRMHSEHKVRCIFIDYLQLLRSGSDNRNSNRENEVARISNGIKALAKELGIPIVVLAQLNRQAEEGDKGPKLSHLRESGSIEQDADIVRMLHRQRAHEADPHNRLPSIDAELIIAKHRNGPTGKLKLLFFPAHTRFRSDSRISDEDVQR
jgi:replicative DNA helicase